MKKYTIVYGEWFNIGSQRHSLVKYERVETDDLANLIKTEERFDCNTHFIFEGWPKLEGEK